MHVTRSKRSILGITLVIATCTTPMSHAGDTGLPTAFWASQPVKAGDTIVVSSAHTTPSTLVKYKILADDTASDPLAKPQPSPDGATEVVPLQATAQSVKFLPTDSATGVYAFWLVDQDSNAVGPMALVNAPDVWFVQGDQGSTASPGGYLRVYGTAMGGMSAGAKSPLVALVQDGHVVKLLEADSPGSVVEGKYSAGFKVPATLPEGTYELYFHNGSGGEAAWTKFSHFGLDADRSVAPTASSTITIAMPAAWPGRVCRVAAPKGNGQADDASFDVAFNCARDLDEKGQGNRASWANEGATILLEHGTYLLTEKYAQGFKGAIPNHSVIDGGKSSNTELSFPNANGGELFSGDSQFVDQHNVNNNYAQGIFGVRNVTITAPEMTEGAGIVFDYMALGDVHSAPFVDKVVMNLGKGGSALPNAMGVVASRVSNVRISDSDLYAGYPVYMNDHVHGASVTGSTLTWYQIALSFRFYSENGVFTGNTLVRMALPSAKLPVERGFAMPTQDVYYANNLSQVEKPNGNAPAWGLTFDENEDLYFGYVSSASGNTITLAGDPSASVRNTYGAPGFSAMVVSGKGSGQMRFVTGSDDARHLTVDRPWDVDPDSSSVLAVSGTLGRMLFVNNNYAASGIQNVFFASSDVIQAGNSITASEGGIQQQVGQYVQNGGYTPGWHFQLLDNDVYADTETSAGLSGQGLFYYNHEQPFPWYTGSVTQTNIIRGNIFSSGVTGNVGLWESVENSLIENNFVPSVRLQNAQMMRDVLIRSNRTENGAGSFLDHNQALPKDVLVK